ncbi:MAG: 4Fe-4S binding protein [Candidatus Glassbacteria bacterium]|nr:4Fe-4S binding protein [Candidatus Glassbacteria bacterium]
MRNARRVSQVLFFVLFLFLLVMTEYKGTDQISYPVKIFFDFDPLVAAAAFFAAHSLPAMMLWSLLTVAVTVAFGRFFCAWVCPMGTLNHVLSHNRLKTAENVRRNRYDRRQSWKYVAVIFLLIASILGLQIVGFLDPFSVLIRSFSLAVNPVFNFLTRALFYPLLVLDRPWLSAIVEPVFLFLRSHVLSFEQPYFYQGLFIGLLFVAIAVLNQLRRRFWCRYLCPLGALLGLLGRFSLLKLKVDKQTCTNCMLCKRNCEGACEPHSTESWMRSECLTCWNCVEACPHDSISLGLGLPARGEASVDIGKRAVLASAAAAVGALALFRIDPRKPPPSARVGSGREGRKFNPVLIRPPGAVAEEEFLKRCIKCGECMKVCIKNAIHPTLMEAGLEGFWSPYLKMQLGYCEFNCTLCGQVCPTGAIELLTTEQKHRTVIGLAIFDMNRCLPYSLGRSCIVCEEVCPTPKKAIYFEEVEVTDREGVSKVIKQPKVDPHLCIGCGICEYACPLVDKPGIYCTSIGESRSQENQLLLDVYGGGEV